LTKNLEAFWACFAQNQVLEEVTFLENAALPILEVNAGFPNSVSDIAKLEQEFLTRGKPGILVLPDDSNLELAASNAQFLPYLSLVLLEVKPEASDLIVEQVSWTQASTLARVWCLENAALDWQELVAKEIASAMRQNAKLTAYLAFENHEPVGMMIALLAHKIAPVLMPDVHLAGGIADGLFALEPGFAGWLAGEARALQTLAQRLSSDFEQAIVAVPLEQNPRFPEAREIERLSVWLKLR
jgi:hypothetical protein